MKNYQQLPKRVVVYRIIFVINNMFVPNKYSYFSLCALFLSKIRTIIITSLYYIAYQHKIENNKKKNEIFASMKQCDNFIFSSSQTCLRDIDIHAYQYDCSDFARSGFAGIACGLRENGKFRKNVYWRGDRVIFRWFSRENFDYSRPRHVVFSIIAVRAGNRHGIPRGRNV